MSWSHGVVQEWALELVVSRHTDPGLKYHPPARPGPAKGTLVQGWNRHGFPEMVQSFNFKDESTLESSAYNFMS